MRTSNRLTTTLVTAAFLLLGATSSYAADRAAASPQLYTCARGGLSRVALTADPAPCCVGMLGGPQLLANTGLEKPKRSNRT